MVGIVIAPLAEFTFPLARCLSEPSCVRLSPLCLLVTSCFSLKVIFVRFTVFFLFTAFILFYAIIIVPLHSAAFLFFSFPFFPWGLFSASPFCIMKIFCVLSFVLFPRFLPGFCFSWTAEHLSISWFCSLEFALFCGRVGQIHKNVQW